MRGETKPKEQEEEEDKEKEQLILGKEYVSGRRRRREELTVFSAEALYGLQEAAVELGRPLHPGSPGSDVPPHGFLLLDAAPHLWLWQGAAASFRSICHFDI